MSFPDHVVCGSPAHDLRFGDGTCKLCGEQSSPLHRYYTCEALQRIPDDEEQTMQKSNPRVDSVNGAMVRPTVHVGTRHRPVQPFEGEHPVASDTNGTCR